MQAHILVELNFAREIEEGMYNYQLIA